MNDDDNTKQPEGSEGPARINPKLSIKEVWNMLDPITPRTYEEMQTTMNEISDIPEIGITVTTLISEEAEAGSDTCRAILILNEPDFMGTLKTLMAIAFITGRLFGIKESMILLDEAKERKAHGTNTRFN